MNGEGSNSAKQKGRRVWRKIEEDALIRCMVNAIGDKWRADNGFKPGFFNLLEKELGKELPDSKLKANPHIDSKVTYWRRTNAKIQDIVNLSGFGWDDVLKCIKVDPKVWAEYEKANKKKAKGMYGKTFPYYDQWQILFGKDRATGEGAEDPHEMAQEDMADVDDVEDYFPFFGEEFTNMNVPDSEVPINNTETPPTANPSVAESTPTPHGSLPTSAPHTSTGPANGGTNKGKKRMRMSNEELVIQQSMDLWLKESSAHMGEMAKSMGHDVNQSSLRKHVGIELKKLNLTNAQRFRLSAIITSCEEKMDDFYGKEDDEKQEWVEAVLSGDVYE